MPRCPQCGAEYVEGSAHCPACEMALSEDQRPPAAPPRGFTHAFSYLTEAYRVLRRCPALLALPLAVTLFNVVESDVGGYLAQTRTQFGRDASARAAASASATPSPWAALSPRVILPGSGRASLVRFAMPITAPALAGVSSFYTDAVLSSPFSWSVAAFDTGILLALLLSYAFVPLGALMMSAYYGIIKDSLTGGPVSYRKLGRGVRRWFVPILGYMLVTALLTAFHAFAGLQCTRLTAAGIGSWASLLTLVSWLLLLLEGMIALVPIAITMDEARFGVALGRGLWTVVRGWRIALALLVLLALASIAPVLIRAGLAAPFARMQAYPPTPGYTLIQIAVGCVYYGLLALLGVWLCLAQFLWYRDANPAAVAEVETEDASNALPESG